MRRIIFAIAVIFTAVSSYGQHSVQVDDGAGHIAILKAPTTGPTGIVNFTLPAGGGTLLTSGSLSGLAWLTTGNTLTGTLPGSPTEFFGSINAADVIFKTAGTERLRILSTGGLKVAGFGTGVVHSDVSGNLTSSLIVAADVAPNAGPAILVTNGGGTVQWFTLATSGQFSGNGIDVPVSLTPGANNQFLTTNGATAVGWTGFNRNATLVGDGVTNAIGLNLANSNTWTANQTFDGATTFIGGNIFMTNASGGIANTSPGANPVIISDLSGLQINALNAGVVHSDGSGLLSSSAVVSADIQDGTVANADLRNSAALSVIGRSTNSAGVPGDITGTANQVLRVNAGGTALGFGTVAAGGIAPGTNNQFLVTTGGAATWAGLSINATLTGNGVGSNLGINLGNANSWTATQTFSNAGNGIIVSNNANIQGNIVNSGGNVTINDNLDITGAGNDLDVADDATIGDQLNVGGNIVMTTAGAGISNQSPGANPVIISDLTGLQVNALNTGVVHSNGAGLLSSSAVVSGDIQDGTIAYGDIQNVTDNRLLGRSSGANGPMMEITVSGGLTLVGGVLTGTSGTVTNVTATLPLSSSGGAAPNITIAQATTNTDGYLSQTDWDTFNDKLSTSLANANIWVGNAGVATQAAPGGDVSMDNLGVFNVNSVQNGAVNLPTDVTGILPDANIPTGISRDIELAAAGDVSGSLSGGYLVNSVQSTAALSIVNAINTNSFVINAANLPPGVVYTINNPAAGNVSGSYSSGFSVNGVQPIAALSIVNAINTSGSIIDADNLPPGVVYTITNPAAGNVSGSYSSGFSVNGVQPIAALSIVTAINTSGSIIDADNLPPGVVYTTTNPAAGNITGNYSTGFSVANVQNGAVNLGTDVTGFLPDANLATITTAGKVSNSATTATSTNTPSTIVLRDGSGDFAAGTITANLSGNATTATSSTNFSGSLVGDVTGTQGATVIAADAVNSAKIANGSIVDANINASAGIVDTKLATIATAGKVANSATTATSLNTPSTIVLRDASGNFAAGTITANLSGNATTATSSTNFSGSLVGDVTGTQGATVIAADAVNSAKIANGSIVDADINASAGIVDTKLATISTAGKVANSATTATSLNTPSTIVLRDASGNFAAGTITANLSGNATTATSSTNFSGSLVGDVTGTQGATVIAADAVNSAKIANGSIVDADINASAGIVDTKLATISTAGKVSNSATTATSANSNNTIVLRDGAGKINVSDINVNNLTASRFVVTDASKNLTSFVPAATIGAFATALTGQLGVASGGTGVDGSTVTDGQLLIGHDANNNFSVATLTAGTGISITNGAGAITISATGGSGTEVTYGATSTQNTEDISSTKYLYDVAYSATSAASAALGARITSTATGTNRNATGLTVNATATGTGTATGLVVSATNGNNQYAALFTSGNVGIGNSDPSTQLDVSGGLSVRDTSVTITSSSPATISVTVGNHTYLRISANGTGNADNRRVTFTDGLRIGQILIVESTGPTDFKIKDGDANSNCATSGDWTSTSNDIITFVWNGTSWLEMSESNNN